MSFKIALINFGSYLFTWWIVHIAFTCGTWYMFKSMRVYKSPIILVVSYCFPIICNFPFISKKGVEIEHLVQTKYGGLKVADLIGKKFGTKVC